MGASRERVLVTGGSGFVGASLAHDLIAAGHDVHLLLRAQSNPWRLAGVAGKYTAHSADLCDTAAVHRAVEACRPEVIYHLATHGVYPLQRDRTTILLNNLIGTANLLSALEACDYRALVHVGSSAEYGIHSEPLGEDAPIEPTTDYGVAKAAASLLCLAEARRGRPITIVRVFAAYGPWEEPTRLVPYVMNCCMRGEPPQVTSGTQARDFVYVDDIVALLRLAAETPQVRGQVLHAATGHVQSVRQMVETILAVCSRGRLHAQFGARPIRADEPPVLAASIERTSALTGWQPRYDARAGSQKMWDWMAANQARRAA